VREQLRQVAATDGAETVNGGDVLVMGLREGVGQGGHRQQRCAGGQVRQELVQAFVGAQRLRLDLRGRFLDVLEQDRQAAAGRTGQQAVFRVLEDQAP